MGKIMQKQEYVRSSLQCYIDLSLFDSFTGETITKDFLPEEEKNKITACEEMLKYMDGSSELLMPKEKIRAVLSEIHKRFKQCNDECRAKGLIPLDLNLYGEEGFQEAIEILDEAERSKENLER